MKTVLLVDNDRFFHALAVCAFAPHPELRLLRAASYLEAIWALSEQQVDLVIAHMGLPDQEGLDLLTYLANYRPKVPVLTLSNSTAAGTSGDTLCWRGHLSKPVHPHSLVARVRNCLRDVERGEHRPICLHDVLRVLAHERQTCMLRVKAGLREGEFQLARGKVLHAACGAETDETAVRQMLGWECPWFRVEPVPRQLVMPSQGWATLSEPLA